MSLPFIIYSQIKSLKHNRIKFLLGKPNRKDSNKRNHQCRLFEWLIGPLSIDTKYSIYFQVRKWASHFGVEKTIAVQINSRKKLGDGGGDRSREPGAWLVRNGESERGILLQNYAIPRNSDNAYFMSYYCRDKMIAVICFCLTNYTITFRCART